MNSIPLNSESKKIIHFLTSITLAFFAGANANAAIWQAIALTTLLAGRKSGHYCPWNGPAPSVLIFFNLLLFAGFALLTFVKINKVEDVYRRFRWIFATAWGIWLVIRAFEALVGGNPEWLARTYMIPDPAIMGMLAGCMTVLLFFRTRRKKN